METRIAVLSLLFPVVLAAEFHSIAQKFGGIECGSCASSLQSSLGRNRSVTRVEVRAAEGVVQLELKPESKFRLEDLRDRLKSVGFTPGVADVSARGKVVRVDGALHLELKGTAARYPIRFDLPGGAAESVVEESIGTEVSVKGLIAAVPGPEAPPLSIRSITVTAHIAK